MRKFNLQFLTSVFVFCSIVITSCQKNDITPKSETFQQIAQSHGFKINEKSIPQLTKKYKSPVVWDSIIKNKLIEKSKVSNKATFSLGCSNCGGTRSIRVYNQHGFLGNFYINPDNYIYDELELQGLQLPGCDRAGVSSTCVAKLISGNIDQSNQSFLSDGQMQAGFFLPCATYAISDLVIVIDQEESLYPSCSGCNEIDPDLLYPPVELFVDANILGNFIDDPNYFETDNIVNNFDESQDPWPTINNVLPKSDFVPYDYRNCLVLAKEQIGKANVRDLGYASSYKTYNEQGGFNLNQSKAAANYIITKLKAGKPVIVGVDNRPGTPSSSNTDGSTDHFVVIVGSGSDANGTYFTFFDSATSLPSKGANSNNKLYYDSNTGSISGTSAANPSYSPYHNYIVTQVRQNNQ